MEFERISNNLLSDIDQSLIVTTGRAIIYHIENEQIFIYLQQIKKPSWTPDKPPIWELPGGKVEEGETIENGLLNELKEEVSLDLSNKKELMQISKFCYRFNNNGGKYDGKYGCVNIFAIHVESRESVSIGNLDEDGIIDSMWVTISDFIDFIESTMPNKITIDDIGSWLESKLKQVKTID